MRGRRTILGVMAILIAVGLIVGIVGATHNVDKALTEADVSAIRRIMADADQVSLLEKPAGSFSQEIVAIRAVQAAVLAAAPDNEGIPLGQSREPADLYKFRSGLCYDRSRAIEKSLDYLGYKTRHVAVYSTRDTGSSIKSLITPGISSHAVTEVLTSRGWMVVDSNLHWMSLGANGNPVSIERMKRAINGSPIAWDESRAQFMSSIFREPFVHVYGLYSRHGQFFPPMTPVPDVNWRDFTNNLI